jgi:phenylacetate-CoA ligase
VVDLNICGVRSIKEAPDPMKVGAGGTYAGQVSLTPRRRGRYDRDMESDRPRRWYVRDECRWPEPLTTFDRAAAPVMLLHHPRTDAMIAASPEEAAVLRALQLVGGQETTFESILDLCQCRWDVTALDVARVRNIVSRFEELGFVDADRLSEPSSSTRRLHAALDPPAALRRRDRLRRVVARVRRDIPLYRETLRDVEVDRLESVAQLPILSKQLVRERLPDLLVGAKNLQGRWWSTSGTTGERLQIRQENGYFARCRLLLGMSVPFAITPEETCAFLTTPVCSGTECHAEMDLPLEKRSFRKGVFYLNSGMNPSRFSQGKLEQMLRELHSERVESVVADAAYLVALARFARDRAPRLPIRNVWLTYEVSSRIHVREIEAAWACHVRDIYGSTECGHLAVSCERGNLHTPADHAILEILGQDSKPVASGELGRVTVTTLNQEMVPLIRYQTSDLARWVGDCACSLGGAAIGPIEGRTSEVIHDTAGAAVTPRMIDDVVSGAATGGIGWYSLVQRAPRTYSMMIVPLAGYDDGQGAVIARALCAKLGVGSEVTVKLARELLPSPSGKFRLCHRDPAYRDA